MLLLVFHIGEARFGIAASAISRVLPLVRLEPYQGAPSAVVGLMNYGGRPVSVVDFSLFLTSEPCRRGTSTRIILIDGLIPPHCHGLMVERAYDTRRFDDERLHPPEAALGLPPYVSAVIRGETGMIQQVDPQALLEAVQSAPVSIEDDGVQPCP